MTGRMEEYALWLRIYEYGGRKKIKPRVGLKGEYGRRRAAVVD